MIYYFSNLLIILTQNKNNPICKPCSETLMKKNNMKILRKNFQCYK